LEINKFTERKMRSSFEQRTLSTLEEYFERAESGGIADFHLRTMRTPENRIDFYIHPQGRDGETGDFTVSGGFVTKLEVAAGSSRKSDPPLLGSSHPLSTD
jgi:hypothetical protein